MTNLCYYVECVLKNLTWIATFVLVAILFNGVMANMVGILVGG